MNGSRMNGSRVITRLRALASIAMLFGAVFTISVLPAYGQQEIDPTWYDPTPSTAAVHSAQAPATAHALQPVVTHRYLQANTRVSQTVQSGKVRARKAQSDQSLSDAAVKENRTLAANKKPTLIASSK